MADARETIAKECRNAVRQSIPRGVKERDRHNGQTPAERTGEKGSVCP